MKKNTVDIILLHGWGSNPDRWNSTKDALIAMNPDVSLHVPFVPGFDPKTSLQRPFTVDDYAEWLETYIEEKGFVRPSVIGHSNGGRIAIRTASRKPNLLGGLILVGAAGIPDKKTLKKLVFKSVAKIGKLSLSIIKFPGFEKISKKVLYKLAGESDYNKASPLMKETMLNMLKYNAREDLGKIKVKTLCIWGTDDTSTPLWMGKEMRRLIKGSQLALVTSGGHSTHITHPTLIAKYIHEFLESENHHD